MTEIFNIFNNNWHSAACHCKFSLKILADKNIKEFEQLFREHFKPLCGFSMKYVHDQDEAKTYPTATRDWTPKHVALRKGGLRPVASSAHRGSSMFQAHLPCP